jgi:phage regulator Rha-like protein
MTKFEETLLREVATLLESRHADVLAFIRFLKVSLPDREKTRSEFLDALKDTRGTAKKYKITQKDIEAEILAVRDGK